MTTIAQALAAALQYHQAGNLQQAETICRQILDAAPGQADALHMLGIVAYQAGNHAAAVEHVRAALISNPTDAKFHATLGMAYMALPQLDAAAASFRRAIGLAPSAAENHYNLGNALKKQGLLDPAAAAYRQALLLKPDFVQAHNNLGNVLLEQHQHAAAADHYRQALRLDPRHAHAHHNLGNALQQLNNLEEAASCYRQALHLKPDYEQAALNLAGILQAQGKVEEALACCQQLLRWNPQSTALHNRLGALLQGQDRLDEAAASYQQALRLAPDCVEAHNNLGNVRAAQGRLEEAIACFQRAVGLDPDSATAHNNVGMALRELGRSNEATAAFQQLLRLNPNSAEAYFNLGIALVESGQAEEAIACYQQALLRDPDQPAILVSQLVHQLQYLCCWDDVIELSRQLLESLANPNRSRSVDWPTPFSMLALPTPTSARQQYECVRHWPEWRWKSTAQGDHRLAMPRPQRDAAKITLGYLSADFRSHPVGYQMVELFERHERDQFAVFGYSYGPDDRSPIRQRIVNAFDRFVDLQDASFAAAARRIEADGVDILIDLQGYTGHARTQILALRPAPVQVNYLGFAGTMGVPFIDYILVDDFVVPPEQQPFFTEKLVHLPGCFMAQDSRREIATQTPSRAQCGLPDTGFVFGCFNNCYKITPAVFDVWMHLLSAIPGSVLWLRVDKPLACANLRREAEARGVAAERLVFAPGLAPEEHLARHGLMDLFLDTMPYNAHSTASTALYAGCPVLTSAGETFVSRVSGSMLRAIGLPELVTTSLAAYHEMALRLAVDADLLATLRSRLQANRSTSRLFDTGQFARGLEQAFTTMWKIHNSAEKPRGFAVSQT